MASKTPNEDLNRLSNEEFKMAGKIPVVVVLDNIRSMHNVGSVFRTCDAFLVKKIVLAGITATPPHRDIHKTALGATESVVWEYQENVLSAVEALRDQGFTVVAVEQASPSVALQDFVPDPEASYAIVFGNEVFGVNEAIVRSADFCLEIPQSGTKHSLNISVSAGIVLWKYYNQLLLKG